MSITKGDIDAVVALYAENPPDPQNDPDQKYYNEPPGGLPDVEYYNETERPESYLEPVPSVTQQRRQPKPRLPAPDEETISEEPEVPELPSRDELRVPDNEVRLPLQASNKSRITNRSDRSTHSASNGQRVDKQPSKKKEPDTNELQYKVEDTPPWYLCIALGFQHYLIMFGATVANPLTMADKLCIAKDDNLSKSQLISTIFFCSGVATLLQTILGIRLPIVQGGTFTFVAPSVAILSLPQWACPDAAEHAHKTQEVLPFTTESSAATTIPVETATPDNYSSYRNDTTGELIWYSRIREIQGAIMVASLFQVLIGFSGIMGFLLRWIGPLAIAPTIALAGLALFDTASYYASSQWWICLVTVILIAMFSQYTKNIGVPCCKYEKGKGLVKISFPLFRLFPVILAIAITWIICIILIVTGVFPEDQLGYGSKSDSRISVLKEAEWFRVPYPGQWGRPTVSAPAVFGMLAGVLASMVESVGDYYACARIAKVPPPPMHAVNRGIGIEGIGCILAGALGSGSGTTSYSENIGAIGITKVASRRVVEVGAVMMILFGVFGKFGALFVTIPQPVIGGVFIVMFGMITAVGISNLQFVDLNSSRNLFIIGFSFFFGLTLPKYISDPANKDAINTGSTEFDEIAKVLLGTSMFVGGMSAFVLDNTIPGTDEERGLTKWRKILIKKKKPGRQLEDPYVSQATVYEIPPITKRLKRWSWTRYIPFLPTFDEDLLKIKSKLPKRRKKKSQPVNGIDEPSQDDGADTSTV